MSTFSLKTRGYFFSQRFCSMHRGTWTMTQIILARSLQPVPCNVEIESPIPFLWHCSERDLLQTPSYLRRRKRCCNTNGLNDIGQSPVENSSLILNSLHAGYPTQGSRFLPPERNSVVSEAAQSQISFMPDCCVWEVSSLSAGLAEWQGMLTVKEKIVRLSEPLLIFAAI